MKSVADRGSLDGVTREDDVGLRSEPAIAPPPRRIRSSSDILRLLPYLKPYWLRWTAMLIAALLSLVATVAIPLMTKAVIDGPVRHQDQQHLWTLGSAAMAVLVSEAVLWFIRRWYLWQSDCSFMSWTTWAGSRKTWM